MVRRLPIAVTDAVAVPQFTRLTRRHRSRLTTAPDPARRESADLPRFIAQMNTHAARLTLRDRLTRQRHHAFDVGG